MGSLGNFLVYLIFPNCIVFVIVYLLSIEIRAPENIKKIIYFFQISQRILCFFLQNKKLLGNCFENWILEFYQSFTNSTT